MSDTLNFAAQVHQYDGKVRANFFETEKLALT